MIIFDAISFPFRDRQWVSKSLVTTFSYLLIFPPFGYLTRITQAVSRKEERGLPEHDLGTELVYGIAVFVGWAIYQIPAFLIYRATISAAMPSFNRLSSLSNVGGSISEISGLLASAGGISISGWLVVQFFGFFFWIGFVRWAASGEIASFIDIPGNINTVREKPMLLIGNYLQQFVASLIVYVLTTISAICICLPFIFIPFYLYVYAYITGKTAQSLGLRAAAPGELSKFDEDF